MKRILPLICILALLFTGPALAFDPGRFLDVDGVTMDYDPSDPSDYRVTAGFGGYSLGSVTGHMLIRYMNAGKSEEIPLMLAAFTGSGNSASHMIVRTDAHVYGVNCTDLSVANIETIGAEAMVLVTPVSVDMLKDMAESSYVKVKVWGEDASKARSFMLSQNDRALLSLFLEEYESEVLPLVTEGSNVTKVYNRLSPVIHAADAEDLSDRVAQVLNTTYAELKMDDYTDDVKRMQQALISLGFLNGKADGIFGKATRAAVSSFQSAYGLPSNGVADSGMLAQLYLSTMQVEEVSIEMPPEEVHYAKLSNGMRSDAVKVLQQRLIELKYLKGKADGVYGSMTADAVSAFQAAAGLKVDGVANAKTQKALFAEDAPKAN